jgi:uncharacterized membrane protein
VHSHTHLAWARLNADAFLLTVLGIISVIRLVNPMGDDLIAEAGEVQPAFYLRTLSYIGGSLLLVVGIMRRRIDVELLGRLVITFAAGFEAWSHVLYFGWLSAETVTHYVLFLAILLVSVARASVMLSKNVTVVHLGGPRR